MKIKKNTFPTLVLELFFPSIANCRKSKIQKYSKIDFPYYAGGGVVFALFSCGFGYGYEAVRIRVNLAPR
jgi:hypothetical protein